ncbi:right-handed parallel beta-helix repeat-containing protein [Amycolatopsis alba]|uniref:right-handed parallel beta-helix repeat-containing protein n=1 Tax=Amycolatopsis alba TaxID=76020 RepID=UPI0003A56626|nr:right-handed parallel beta-helix repeat-containing protein [Amycolatopsis alba]
MTALGARSVGALAAALLVIVSTATPSAAEPRPATYFVDCQRGSDEASGTRAAAPWASVAKASARTYAPGDRVVFRAGTRCDGMFAPKGSGTPGKPITVGSYGSGAKPAIDAHGALAAVLLDDVEGWEIEDLALSNLGPAPGAHEIRFGVYARLTDYGVGRHYVVRDVDVHDVNGCQCQNPSDPDPSGGILFKAAGTGRPTGFDDVLVDGNTVTRTGRTAIGTSSDWQRRPEYPSGTGSAYVPITRLRITGNTLRTIHGDGIGVYNGLNALVEDNVLDGYAIGGTKYTTGMFAYNSNGTRIRYNTVSDGKGGETLPSQSFMVESASLGTVYEHNLSRRSDGGLLIVCNDPDATADRTVFRYNVSLDDNSLGRYPNGDRTGVFTMMCGDPGSLSVYGNVVRTGVAEVMVNNVGDFGASFVGNLFSGRPGGSRIDDPKSTYRHNVFLSITGRPQTGAFSATPVDAGARRDRFTAR